MIFQGEAVWRHPETRSVPQQIAKVGKVALEATAWITATVAATAVSMGMVKRDFGADMAHFAFADRTSSEATIEAALKKAHGKEVMIRCANIPDNAESDIVTYGYVHFPLIDQVIPAIRVDDDICDTVVTLKPQTEPSDPNLPWIARSVEVITHEYQHVNKHDTNEGVTTCYDIQTTEATALALGASPDVAAKIAEYARIDPTGAGIAKYTLPEECHDGGKYDLDKSQLGNFPNTQQAPYSLPSIIDTSPFYYPDNTGFRDDQLGEY